MASKKTKSTKKVRIPRDHLDSPATVGIVYAVRDELKADMSAFRNDTEERFKGVDARFKEIDARFNQVDARFDRIDARFAAIDARFDRVDASLHRMELLFEEQRSENRVTLDAIKGFVDSQARLNERVTEVENTVRYLARPRDKN